MLASWLGCSQALREKCFGRSVCLQVTYLSNGCFGWSREELLEKQQERLQAGPCCSDDAHEVFALQEE